ncbi:MAG: tetratricopeptide repeat-containing glycosyltransferase family protein [Dongiaceae bacterium]
MSPQDAALAAGNAQAQVQAQLPGLFDLAANHVASGRIEDAEQVYNQILGARPNNPIALHRLGLLKYRKRDLESAETLIRKALAVRQNFPNAWSNLGVVLNERGKKQEAIDCYHHAIEFNPNHANAFSNLGNSLKEKGVMEAAVACYQRAIDINPSVPDPYNNLAAALRHLGNLPQAEATCRKAIELNPNHADSHVNLGAILKEQGRTQEAMDCYHKALEINPNSAAAYTNLGVVLRDEGRLEEAMNCHKKAIDLRPNAPESYNNFAVALRDLGRLDEAVEFYRKSIAIDPGIAEHHTNLAHALLLMGQLDEGWKENEWRWKSKKPTSPVRNFTQPQWDGSRLDGKTILLHAEQGLGDTINFIRYVSMVKPFGGRVILEVQPKLDKLCRSVAGYDEYYLYGQQLPHFDVQAPLLTLPYIFRTNVDTIPSQTPYLSVDKPCPIRFPEDGKLRVGLVWAGNPKFVEDKQRSPRLEAFLPLFDIPGVQFYCLQKGDGRADMAGRAMPACFTDCDGVIEDFVDTGAIMKELDLVISSCTSPAHVAGALARPLWLVLPFMPDYRWLMGRPDTPWYPTARLFRQSEPANWRPVMQEVAAALRERAARGR